MPTGAATAVIGAEVRRVLRCVAAGILRGRREHQLAAEHILERVVGADGGGPVRRAQQTPPGPVADHGGVGAAGVSAGPGYASRHSLVGRRGRVVDSAGVRAARRRDVTRVGEVGVARMEIFPGRAQVQPGVRHLVVQVQVEAVDMGAARVADHGGGAVERADLIVPVVIVEGRGLAAEPATGRLDADLEGGRPSPASAS